MGRRRTEIMLAVTLVVAAGGINLGSASPKEGLLGLWLTEDGDAHIRIERCNDGLCGRVVWMSDRLDESGAAWVDAENPDPDLRGRQVTGMTILRIGDTPDAKGVHRGGRIYDPKSGRTYRCTLRQDGDSALRMRGFLGISLIGRTTRWSRLPDDGDAVYDPHLSLGR